MRIALFQQGEGEASGFQFLRSFHVLSKQLIQPDLERQLSRPFCHEYVDLKWAVRTWSLYTKMGRLAVNGASSRNEQSKVILLLCIFYQVKYNFNIKKFNAKCYPMKESLPSIHQEALLLSMLQRLGSLFNMECPFSFSK